MPLCCPLMPAPFFVLPSLTTAPEPSAWPPPGPVADITPERLQQLGYDPGELAALPGTATAGYAGLANPLVLGPLRPGEIVLDHACSSALDLLLAARRVGPTGRAIGVHAGAAKRAAIRVAAMESFMASLVEMRPGSRHEVPIESGSVDVVISNGAVIDLDEKRCLAEVRRVLKPQGRLYLTARAASELSAQELLFSLATAGLHGAHIVHRREDVVGLIAHRR